MQELPARKQHPAPLNTHRGTDQQLPPFYTHFLLCLFPLFTKHWNAGGLYRVLKNVGVGMCLENWVLRMLVGVCRLEELEYSVQKMLGVGLYCVEDAGIWSSSVLRMLGVELCCAEEAGSWSIVC